MTPASAAPVPSRRHAVSPPSDVARTRPVTAATAGFAAMPAARAARAALDG